jgi:hypothetical protein
MIKLKYFYKDIYQIRNINYLVYSIFNRLHYYQSVLKVHLRDRKTKQKGFHKTI